MSPPEAAKSSRNYKVRKGMRVQTRDREIIWMTGTHGLVTMMHLKLFAFEGKDETGRWRSVSEQAVYRRLGKLCEAGFLEHQRTWYGDHGVYRATKAGLSLVGLDLSPARLDRRDYEHDLQVVDLALWLTDYSCDGWIPERMIRSRLKVGMSIGRVPDGLLIGPGPRRRAGFTARLARNLQQEGARAGRRQSAHAGDRKRRSDRGARQRGATISTAGADFPQSRLWIRHLFQPTSEQLRNSYTQAGGSGAGGRVAQG